MSRESGLNAVSADRGAVSGARERLVVSVLRGGRDVSARLVVNSATLSFLRV